MITQNGLNLFKVLLTNSCLDPSDFTNVHNGTDYETSHATTIPFYPNKNSYYNGSEGTPFTGTFVMGVSGFMPYFRNKTAQLNVGADTRYWTASTTMTGGYMNYLPEGSEVITIPSGVGSNNPTQLMTYKATNYGVGFANIWCGSTGTLSTGLYGYSPFAIFGTAPSKPEYITVNFNKRFYTSSYLNMSNLFGAANMYIYANLGYSNNTESVDDYDLASPVFNKKLNPIEMTARSSDGKIEFTIAFKNFESESIFVNELGLYNSAESQPIYAGKKISLNGYKFGRYSSNIYDSALTLYDDMYITAGIRPNLIVRKVLPQTITIPPDGIATFKYTIDLSEMKAQENIAYEQ